MSSSTIHIDNPIIVDPTMFATQNSKKNEIDIFAIWSSLIKQRKVFFITFFVILLVGISLFLYQKTLYTYSTTIEIGTQADNATLIQSVKTVESQIKLAYINQALHEYFSENPSKAIKVEVKNPKKTDILVISSEGTDDERTTHLNIHQNILEKIVNKHSLVTSSIKEELSRSKEVLLNKIEELENGKLFADKVTEAKNAITNSKEGLKLLETEKTALENYRSPLTQLEHSLQTQYNSALKRLVDIKSNSPEIKDEKSTPFLILLTSEIEKLDERLHIKLPQQFDNLEHKISENLKKQQNQKLVTNQASAALSQLYIDRDNELTLLRNQLNVLTHSYNTLAVTKAIVPPSRSFEPSNNRNITVLIAIIVGLFLGFVNALLASLIARESNS